MKCNKFTAMWKDNTAVGIDMPLTTTAVVFYKTLFERSKKTLKPSKYWFCNTIEV